MKCKRTGFVLLAVGLLLLLQGEALAQGMATGGTAAAATIPAFTRTLKRGCRGADVKVLQGRLNELGVFKGTCDGLFGIVTQNAVKSIQRSRGLRADGIVGKALHNAIYGAAPAAPPEPAAEVGEAVVAYPLGKLNNQVLLRKGNKGANVRDLQTVLKMKGFYTGSITGNLKSDTVSAVMRFQRSVQLKADGKAGNYTLSALYTLIYPPDLDTIVPWPQQIGENLALPVEKLTWTNVAKSVFLRKDIAVIVDVRTGYSFQVKRTGGTKHADVETLTPLDTATFYKSAGDFSWNRRPVWVIVRGRRLAASMNCMPHGYDTIADNDFKGQFCIHFVGSRTHSSRKVDPDHKKCIEEAYMAGLLVTALPATPSPSPTPPSPEPSLEPTLPPAA